MSAQAVGQTSDELGLLADNETLHRFAGVPGDDWGRYLTRCGIVVSGFALELDELNGETLCRRCYR